MKINPDDPRLTAYVLGELEPDEAAAVEEAVLLCPDLQDAVSELRGLHENLVFELVVEPELELTPEQRKEVLTVGRSSLITQSTQENDSAGSSAADTMRGGEPRLPGPELPSKIVALEEEKGNSPKWISVRTVAASGMVAACVAALMTLLVQWMQTGERGEKTPGLVLEDPTSPESLSDSDIDGFRENPKGPVKPASPEMAEVTQALSLLVKPSDLPPEDAPNPIDKAELSVPEIPRLEELLDRLENKTQMGDSIGKDLPAPLSAVLPRANRLPDELNGGGDEFPAPPEEGLNEVEDLESVPLGDMPFQWTKQFPKSYVLPFVDSVSYKNVRRYLDKGAIPRAHAVHAEEMINYFDYRSPSYEDGIFGIDLETAECPWASDHKLVRIALKARAPEAVRTAASRNYVFLIDTGSSMLTPARLGMLSESAALLVQSLGPRDRVTVLTYSGSSARLVVGPIRGDYRVPIAEAFLNLDRSEPVEGTPIRIAYRAARGAFVKNGDNRIILLTDQNIEAGAQSRRDLVDLARLGKQHGISLIVGGIGGGVLDTVLLTQLELEAGATCNYLDGAGEAARFFGSTLARPATPLANNLAVEVEFNRNVVDSYRLIGYANRPIDPVSPDIGRAQGIGEVRDGYSLTVLYEVVPVTAAVDVTDFSRFERETSSLLARAGKAEEPEPRKLFELTLGYDIIGDGKLPIRKIFPAMDEDVTWTESSPDFRFSAAVAGFAMLLRESPHRGNIHCDLVLDLAESGLANDPYGLRKEFVDLVRKSSAILP